VIGILGTLAEHYGATRCASVELHGYFVGYLARVYRVASERAEVHADFGDVADLETRARYEGSMVALVALAVEHPRFARELRKRLPELDRLLALLARNEGAGRPVRSPPPHRVEPGRSGPVLVDPSAVYIPWENAGGPDECAHGRAAGVPCPECQADEVAGEHPGNTTAPNTLQPAVTVTGATTR